MKKFSKQQAKEEIEKLIEKYKVLSADDLKSYNEANTRKNFILPFFEALGWDIRGEEVIEEESASGKRVDYAFKISGITRLFLEAKPLSADLDVPKWAEQAIWYAWHKSVPWAILTDFESIKIFNAEWDEQDAERSLVFEIPYKDYLTNEKLWLLSREATEKGELEKFAETEFKKPKRVAVDKQLVVDLLRWRDQLFKDFKGYNPIIDEKKISENVQRVLNRLIFIRTCEDRGLEEKKLQEMVRNWEGNSRKNNELVTGLRDLFSYYDKSYDSKLFEEKIIFESDKFIVDDNTLAKVIDETYKNPNRIRWNFNDINQDVLGSIYEQYLGHIQKEEKENGGDGETKRKSQGIYYTPRYIVDYIVRNTLGEILKTKKPEGAKDIKILDPACGSGSFLIRAYEELINYWEIQLNEQSKFKKGTHLGIIEKTIKQREGQKILSAEQKMDILRSNIYGVDLDEEAVEIAQLNLLLKTVNKRAKLLNLQHILCGNSLISSGEAELKEYFGKNWKAKKPFNWLEKFPEVFKDGGFDIIIGNPPYVNLANIEDVDERQWLKDKYETAKNKSDLYSFFIERAINLLKLNGVLGFIVSNSWLGTDSFSKFREYLVKNTTILQMVELPLGVFEEATVTPVLIFLQKSKAAKNHFIELFEFKNNKFQRLTHGLSYQRIIDSPNYNFSFSADLRIKIPTIPLGEIAKFSLGIKTSDDKKFILDEKIDNNCYKLLRGKDVARYSYKYANKWIWYRPDLMMKKVGAGPRRLEFFLKEKIFIKDIAVEIIAIFDDQKYLSTDTLSLIYSVDNYDLKFILALLNSRFINRWYEINFSSGLHIKINELQNIPIPKINFSKEEDKKKYDELVKLADKMAGLNIKIQKFHPVFNDEEYNELKKEIEKTNKEIDKNVYKLYDLTPEEIKIIEKAK